SFIKHNTMLTSDEAAAKIQRAWRRHIDMQVFRYYRDLINFKQKGDPALMLKSINPMEAKMLDAASGVHVKFRLAGETFPPNIFYKIFTHRPVQDMCANSPKDYTRPEAKLQDCRQLHNTRPLDFIQQGPERDGWYRRIENNGWRLVSDRALAGGKTIDPDPASGAAEFHHDRLQRRADLAAKRKQRRVQWLMKMHREGLLKSREPEAADLVESAADGMVRALEAGDEVEDWEVEELLHWSTCLDFEQYASDWGSVATTAPSDEQLRIAAQFRILQNTAAESSVSERHLNTADSRPRPVAPANPAAVDLPDKTVD
ncbi:hypothetical protein BOX15_Mlig026939g2, partial [Macrostomum lignano]